MTAASHAIAADRAEDVVVAADLYEQALDEDSSQYLVLDLAVLYWTCIDPGFSSRVSSEFFHRAGDRLFELLADAVRLFPDSTEATFWKRYIEWLDLGVPFEIAECRELLRKDPEVLIPAMRLFGSSEGNEARVEAEQLLLQARIDGTARARYIVSVIEGVLHRRGEL